MRNKLKNFKIYNFVPKNKYKKKMYYYLIVFTILLQILMFFDWISYKFQILPIILLIIMEIVYEIFLKDYFQTLENVDNLIKILELIQKNHQTQYMTKEEEKFIGEILEEVDEIEDENINRCIFKKK